MIVKECPDCGYVIEDVVFEVVRYDFGCPRCGKSFDYFVRTDKYVDKTDKSKPAT